MTSGFTHESPHNETHEWYTPPSIFQSLGLSFDLDPASPGPAIVPWIPAARHLTVVDDGLHTHWDGRVWLNPPYGPHTSSWVRRFIAHQNGIMLVFSRTDTGWFQNYATHADLLCFVRGRIAFLRPDGTPGSQPGCGSLLLACGAPSVEALRRADLGFCCPGRPRTKSGS